MWESNDINVQTIFELNRAYGSVFEWMTFNESTIVIPIMPMPLAMDGKFRYQFIWISNL